jgi:excinuclease UvrABC nuclease subunit
MINNIAEIQIHITSTELEALILEDRLIKQYLPPYNVKQKKFRSQAYLTITHAEFPALKIIGTDEIDFTQRIFGPFKDKYTVENIIHLLQKILKLRACTDPLPSGKCLLAGIGKCLAPCLNKISAEQYKQIVEIAVEFLQGNPQAFLQIIDTQIMKKASELEFEEAAELRNIKEFCHNFQLRQIFMHHFMSRDILITKGKYRFLFQKGELRKIYQTHPEEKNLTEILNRFSPPEIKPSFLMDRAYVVWVWFKQNKAKYLVIN